RARIAAALTLRRGGLGRPHRRKSRSLPTVCSRDTGAPSAAYSGVDRVMKIAVGNDPRGVTVKQRRVGLLTELGHEVIDLGANSAASVDYPDYAIPVAEDVCSGKV